MILTEIQSRPDDKKFFVYILELTSFLKTHVLSQKK